eukprot:CAMPEP_0172387762 /NCGR_PEP_ID=MMETSP1061-20121228/5011_1 /TAXON_ID=37318 /ORGANISM="Pseudo-nitzschia pungens, Strain cf. pungens" /LENGTH=677 /DNA_ID=CAMNT_0013117491 /DNA_START=132 /DNA_END=2165 /DNA_ORIENTATION=+
MGISNRVRQTAWYEDIQIDSDANEEVQKLIRESEGCLRIFGYGSLCWNPGTDGGLLKASQTLGQVQGYKRAWAQRSTDHRGTVDLHGIVCTLLTKDEYYSEVESPLIDSQASKGPTDSSSADSSSAEVDPDDERNKFSVLGVLYTVPPELAQKTLAELDFREREGYAREICYVVEEGSNKAYRALTYRGTPDNPVFSKSCLVDLPLSAAIISVSIGPSGANDVYLNNLHVFLKNANNLAIETDDTNILADMVRSFQKNYQLYFLSGGGSNQHNQLLLNRPRIPSLAAAADSHLRTEIILPTAKDTTECPPPVINNAPTAIYAGGGHSALLTKSGRLFLWGWNKDLQCGIESTTDAEYPPDQPLPFTESLPNIVVESAALGFSHTLVVEKQTNRLYAFGNDERGQVTGRRQVPLTEVAQLPTTPEFLKNEKVEIADAGLFHSAVVTKDGELITFGCDRFGQSNLVEHEANTQESGDDTRHAYRRWRPTDADRIIDVSCGRRHTVAVDSLNRIWTFGENKYGQLGRKTEKKKGCKPSLVDMDGKIRKDDIVRVDCGWSHTIIHVKSKEGNKLFGWGRNDKGQLGNGSNAQVDTPIEIFSDKKVKNVQCGSESTMVIDDEDQIWGCGWNEHGNLGTGKLEDAFVLSRNQGVNSCTPPHMVNSKIALAVGGAHYIIAAVEL